MGISPDVMIMTRAEFQAAELRAFHRGCERGRFEQRCDDSKQNNPPSGPSKDKDLVSPDAGGGPNSIERAPLAKALFQIERNPAIADQAWFGFYGKADLILAAIANPQQ